MATKLTNGRRGNKNAEKWTFEDDMAIHESVAERRAEGLSDRAAARRVAQDRKIYSKLPQPGGPHRNQDSNERRFSRIAKRLQGTTLILARAVLPRISAEDLKKLQNETDPATSQD